MKALLRLQALRFVLVGALGFAVNLAVFAAAKQHGMPLLLCAAAAFLVAETHNFAWHRSFTFGERSHTRERYVIFTIVSIAAAVAAAAMMSWMVDNAAPAVLAQAVSVAAVAIVSFLVHRRFTFAARTIA